MLSDLRCMSWRESSNCTRALAAACAVFTVSVTHFIKLPSYLRRDGVKYSNTRKDIESSSRSTAQALFLNPRPCPTFFDVRSQGTNAITNPTEASMKTFADRLLIGFSCHHLFSSRDPSNIEDRGSRIHV
ncbi:hypothetical protein BDN71DRAFT_681648 [Pleurotus eryngii]|uniref:Uncharacterized protein n=1 Tax=Pleurotus eryngii TaxID=5323 RepID=A0A9P6DH13_PLEER|nr:hypothetical protein BDN71DRAFT_681648 [Pleurotus eryngii]